MSSASDKTGELRRVFQPHRFRADEEHIDLYHVYDNLSQTPFQHGVGIQCGDSNEYVMNAWHVITPLAMQRHLSWRNRYATQFISFYDSFPRAWTEQQRRISDALNGYRDTSSVLIAHVRLPRYTNVWLFSRDEMLCMMHCLGANPSDFMATSAPGEWFVWGCVPEHLVVNREEL